MANVYALHFCSGGHRHFRDGPGDFAGALRRLTRDSCDDLVRIPMAARGYGGGALESLNVSNAAAVALFALSRRRG